MLVFLEEKIEIAIGVSCISASMIIAFTNVITRYVFNYSIPWSEEVLRFLVIWMCFGGAAHAFRLGVNVGVEFLINKFPPTAAKTVYIITRLITIFYFGVILYFGWLITVSKFQLGQISPAGSIPMWIPNAAMPVGAFLVIIRLIREVISIIKKFRTEQKEESE